MFDDENLKPPLRDSRHGPYIDEKRRRVGENVSEQDSKNDAFEALFMNPVHVSKSRYSFHAH